MQANHYQGMVELHTKVTIPVAVLAKSSSIPDSGSCTIVHSRRRA